MIVFSSTTGYAAFVDDPEIHTWDLATNTPLAPIPVGSLIGDMAYNAGFIYVRSVYGNPLYVIDTSTNKVVATITLK